MFTSHDQKPPKKTTNFRINSDLATKAINFETNLSSVLEQALTDQLKTQKAQQWLEQNKTTITAYNRAVNDNGVFSDKLRSF